MNFRKLAHNTKRKDDVGKILVLAENAGGKIEKQAQDVFLGGYSGYFSDPDGCLWQIVYYNTCKFNENGSIVIE